MLKLLINKAFEQVKQKENPSDISLIIMQP